MRRLCTRTGLAVQPVLHYPHACCPQLWQDNAAVLSLSSRWSLPMLCAVKFFLEPVVRAVNYAVNVLGYKKVAMTGLSGGGWTTVLGG